MWLEGEGNMKNDDNREPFFDTAESETPSTHGNSMRENRETPATPSTDGSEGQSDAGAPPMKLTGIVLREPRPG